VVWAVAALLGGIALMRVAGCGGDAGQEGGVRIARSTAPAAGSSQRADGGGGGARIYVHVAGAVRRPGLLRLPDGARVAAAVDRAGGPLRRADLSGLNLAARLEDGQQVIVPRRGATPGAAGSPAATGAPPPGSAGAPKLSLGAATVEQLDGLDGIGPTLAQRIVEYRTEHGGFRSLSELREVEGIGEKRFASLREALQP